MKTYILCCLLGAIALSGCVWGHIERSQTLTEETASSLVGKEVKVNLAHSIMSDDGTILGITRDSLVLSVMEGSRRNVALANVNDIVVEGSGWGRMGGGLALGAIGAAIGASAAEHNDMSRSVNGFFGFLLGSVVGGLLGEGFITPDRRYIVTPKKSDVLEETKQWNGANPQYVLVVERFLAETDSTVTIPWQGKTVELPKSEITIEKHEKGYRVTVPARLLQ